jgi:hypothetical protein
MFGKKLADLGKVAFEVGAAAGQVAKTYGSDLYDWAAEKAPDLDTIARVATRLKLDHTAVPVKAICEPTGDGVDDYNLVINIDEVAKALNEGRTAVPQITVYARSPEQIDRDLLAERLETAMKPLLKHYEEHVKTRKKAILAKRQRDSDWSFWDTLDLTILAAIFPPVILVLMALDFVEFMSQIPALIMAKFKGDEISRLDQELALARATVKKIVRRMKIEQLA